MNEMKHLMAFLTVFLSLPVLAQGGANPSAVEFITPGASQTVEITYRGSIPLTDDRQILRMKSAEFNHTILTELQERLSDGLAVEGTVLSALSIVGYGAPAGNRQRNETNAAGRCIDLKQSLLASDFGGAALNVSWVTEDWDSLLTLIDHSQLTLRIAASDIIRHVEPANGREEQLMMLGGGSFYKAMQEELCPGLWRMEWTATLRRTRYGTQGGALLVDGGRKVLSLSDLYELACRYPVGSSEFCAAIDFCQLCYPDNDVAQLNAAGAALVRGDLSRAKSLLAPYEGDSRAYNNIGVLCLLQGQRERAGIFLNLAAAAGSAKARQLLNSGLK